MNRARLPAWGVVALAIAVLVLAAGSTVAIAAGTGAFDRGHRGPRCAAPSMPGALVQVTLADMGASSMMTGRNSMMPGAPAVMGGMFRVVTDRTVVPAGAVSFVATNVGRLTHELVVLPLRDAPAGARQPGSDGRVDEETSVGEASRTCGRGEGDGIEPGSTGWVTLQLAPGRYELVCNLPGHYAAGMFTELTVS